MRTLINTLLLLLPLLAGTALSDQGTTDLINRVCKKTSDFGFCDGILERNLISPRTGIHGLTRLTLNLTMRFAKDTMTFIQQSEAAANQTLGRMYHSCWGNYQSSMAYMQGAASDAAKSDYEHMVQLLKLSGDPIILCENSIGGVAPAVVDKSRLLRVLLEAALYEGWILLFDSN